MSARSTQAWRLAQSLSKRVGREVELRYHGPRKDSYGGWHVAWCDGPTRTSMQAAVGELLALFPELRGLKLYYDRNRSDQSEAAALLAYLSAHTAELASVNSWTVEQAFNETERPEELDDRVKARAWALCNADPKIRNYLSVATLEHLRERGAEGWDSVVAWLDGILAARANPDIRRNA